MTYTFSPINLKPIRSFLDFRFEYFFILTSENKFSSILLIRSNYTEKTNLLDFLTSELLSNKYYKYHIIQKNTTAYVLLFS